MLACGPRGRVAAMEIQGADPRLFKGHEYDEVEAYWVIFWNERNDSDEYRITGASNILEVLAWASHRAGKDLRYGVWVETGSRFDPKERYMAMILGSDPNNPDSGS